jgi:bacterioferritin-associated ferredoxin
MIVCICRALSEQVIRAAIFRGASTVEEVGTVCRAGTACGSCHVVLQRMIEAAEPPVGEHVCASMHDRGGRGQG